MQWLANSGWLRMPIHQFRSCHAARPIATCHAMSPPFLTCLTYKSYSVSEPMLCKAGRLWMLHDAAWIGLWSPLFVCDVLHRAAESAINRSSWVQSRKGGTNMRTSWLVCCRSCLTYTSCNAPFTTSGSILNQRPGFQDWRNSWQALPNVTSVSDYAQQVSCKFAHYGDLWRVMEGDMLWGANANQGIGGSTRASLWNSDMTSGKSGTWSSRWVWEKHEVGSFKGS